MTMLKYIALTLPLALAQPVMAQSVTITNGNGGTVQKDRSCDRSSGVANCSTTTTGTSASGQTYSKERLRTTQAGSSTTTVNRTGAGGQTNSRTRSVLISR
ncbi:hypothetical protein [Actibacterium ureilyticum]|uniref:hypothetical protein n=1 Tax=Actibacterium ureilyticum TaxID=1590614 RepID=UPI000BAAB8FD|nr:hypothetical protein [Actibacterium ureilyticum]